MISSFDKQNLEKLLKDFYTAVGIRISIFDAEFRPVIEYPHDLPNICQIIRGSARGERACQECDRAACMRAKKLREPHIYTCHAGLTEAITPIRLVGGVVGYAILAHMMPVNGYAKAVSSIIERAQVYGGDKDKISEAVREIAPRSSEQIHAVVRLLDAVSAYVQMKNYANWNSETIAKDIDEYIRNNLSRKITGNELCTVFHCSRSSLYQLSEKYFGMGIIEYVSSCRIEQAKKLLSNGTPTSEIVQLTGYSDYSYFCRVFRKAIGITPAQYRKRNQ